MRVFLLVASFFFVLLTVKGRKGRQDFPSFFKEAIRATLEAFGQY